MLDKSYYFDCQCRSPEHTLRFLLDKEYNELYTEIYLNQWRSLWKRIFVAVKYIFGYKNKYGAWDCWILNKNDAKRLRDMCDEFIN